MTPIGGILKLDNVKFLSTDGADTKHQTVKEARLVINKTKM